MRWLTVLHEVYLTPKSSTTRVNWIGRVVVAGFVEAFFKEVMTKAASLRQPIHPTGATDVYPSIGCCFFV